jgi:hypothetical protein
MNIKRNTNTRNYPKIRRKREFTCIEYVNNHNMHRGVCVCVNV